MNRREKYATQISETLARFEGRDYDPASPGRCAWNVHHGVRCEPLTEPIINRIHFIVDNKDEHEIKIRLRWLAPVIGELPAAWAKACAAWAQACAAWAKADAAWVLAHAVWAKARVAWAKACAAWEPELAILHAEEQPGCPFDGKTLFPEKGK
jgi:hypothetical protein